MAETHSSPKPGFQGLYDSILAYRGWSLYWHVLKPWVDSNPSEIAWLTAIGSRRGDPIPPATVEELWELYALNRTVETLLLRFQQGRADGTDWLGPEVTLNEYSDFATSLRLSVIKEQSFSPFYHEIVEVAQESESDDVILLETIWPGLMLGDMMFSRAGVQIAAGPRAIRKEIAESSTLYWAFRRKNRPYHDLSHGWGHNSQWRTCFRRDFRIGRTLYFNADGDRTISALRMVAREDDDDLTAAERIELLTHRCFVTTTKSHTGLFPYDDTYQLQVD